MTGTTPIDTIIQGDCLEEMKKLPDRSIDAIVTDPPYELTSGNSKKGFMGKAWDGTGIAYNVEMWGECLRVLKPGGHLLAFGGSRTYHRMACAIEDVGFEIRDSIHWCYGSGFPKSLSIERAVDKANGTLKDRGKRFNAAGVGKSNGGSEFRSDHPDYKPYEPISDAAKQWAGWGSALKPAHEPIVLARKPLDGCTIAENVLRWGRGGLNVDGCRINPGEIVPGGGRSYGACDGVNEGWKRPSHADYESKPPHTAGRFPSNLIHDNSPEVLAEFAKAGERKTGHRSPTTGRENNGTFNACKETLNEFQGSFGSASRFFMACEFTPADYAPIVYYAKASRSEREAGLDGMPDAVMPFNEIGFDETKRGRQPRENKAKNHHPTVKPLELIKYLSKLICPPGGLILDPFGGSGTTGIAAIKEGFHYILIEKEPEYCEIARKRIAAVPARLDRWAEADA